MTGVQTCALPIYKINDQKVIGQEAEIYYTVEEQINDLISLSTDPDVTMRQFNGLNCWV